MKALFTLNKYIWKYKKQVLLGIFFVVLSNVFGVFPPQIIRSAINMVGEMINLYSLHNGYEAQSVLRSMILQSLFIYGLLVVLMAVLRGVFLLFTRQTLIVMSRKVEYDLRNNIFDHYQSLPLIFYRKNKTGDMMARITEDLSSVRNYLGPGIMYTLNTISLMIILITTMFFVNAELTLYALIPLPILSLSIYFIESVIQRRSDKIQRQLSRLTSYTQEVFSRIRVIKSYVRELSAIDKMAEESELYKKRSMALVKINALFMPMILLLVGLANVITIWVGGMKVINGSLTLGNIAEFIHLHQLPDLADHFDRVGNNPDPASRSKSVEDQ